MQRLVIDISDEDLSALEDVAGESLSRERVEAWVAGVIRRVVARLKSEG